MGIIIPMVMPRITVGPASFTLASHVPVFMAMFISPAVAIAVSLGTGFGFFLSATPIIALRALSHLLFAVLGAFILQKYPYLLANKQKKFTLVNGRLQLFNLVIALVHSAAELLVVSAFYTMGNLPGTYYTQGYMYSVFLLMGIGGIIHSLVDFNIAYFLAAILSKHMDIPIFTSAKKSNDRVFLTKVKSTQ
jgi:niacin transporter